MHIVSMTAAVVRVPLKKKITHASHSRHDSDNLIVRCTLDDGTVGYGEGVPRAYVTGETAEGALAMFAATPLADPLAATMNGWSDVVTACDTLRFTLDEPDPRGCHANALRCAVELSVLDAFGRHAGEPLHRVTGHVEGAETIARQSDQVRYSTTITADSPAAERRSAAKMRLYGFHQCKIKVGMPGVDDSPRLRRLRRWLGRRVDIRLDANEAWTPDQAADQIRRLQPIGATCIEQPIPHGDWQAMAALRQKVDTPIMLDESLTSMPDAEQAVAHAACDLFNIRLSKCGGFLASLRLAAFARRAGLGIQLGCHPGETGLLSAAGRHWATSVGDIRYLEGSYDRHLLVEPLTDPDITFRYGGRAKRIDRPGLGVDVDVDTLTRWQVGKAAEVRF